MKIIHNFNVELLSTYLPSEFHCSKIVLYPCQFADSQNHHDSEIWHIEQGNGALTSNLTKFSIKAGDLIFFDPFEHHAMYNNSIRDLHFTAYWYNDWEKINKITAEFFNQNLIIKNVTILAKLDGDSENHMPIQSALEKILAHDDVDYIEKNHDKKVQIKLDKYLVYRLGLHYKQSEYYLSYEQSLFTKFTQDVSNILLSNDIVCQALRILRAINHSGNSVILSNLEDFSMYAIFIPHVINILDQHALKNYPKVVLIETIDDCHEIINQQINLLFDIFNKLSPLLADCSNITPEPGQWLGDDVLFFNDIRKCMLEFHYFTQYTTFNVNSIALTIKKCLLEVSIYIDRSIQLRKVIDVRYSRTRIALSIHGMSVLLEMLCPFLGNAEEIINKLLNVNFIDHNQQKIQFGTRVNFEQIMIKFKERLNAKSR